MNDKEKARLVALQKQLRIAREALLKIQEYARSPDSIARAALYEMEQIEAASKPDHGPIHFTRFG